MAPGRTPRRDDSRRWPRLARQLLPWLVAAGLLAFLAARVPIGDLRDALARTSILSLAGLAALFVTLTLVADVATLWVTFRYGLRDQHLGPMAVGEVRAASYLLQLVSFGAGQGGMVYLLKRHHGVSIGAGAGAILLATGVSVIVLAGAVALGLGLGAVPDRAALRWLTIAVAAGIPIYLIIIWARPLFLARTRLLAPLFDAGVTGTVWIAVARALHLTVAMAGHYLAMRMFGIDVPVEAAVARLPVVFLIGALPLAPSGLGTTQAAAVTLFASFAPGATASAREAVVLSYSLAYQVLGAGATALWGLAGLRRLTARAAGNDSNSLTPPDDPA